MPTLDKYEPGKSIFDVADKDWRRIENALGIKRRNLPLRNSIERAVVLSLYPMTPEMPRVSSIRRRLDRVKGDADRLAATLDELVRDSDERGEADAEIALGLLQDRYTALCDDRAFGDPAHDASTLRKAVTVVLQLLPQDKGGRRYCQSKLA